MMTHIERLQKAREFGCAPSDICVHCGNPKHLGVMCCSERKKKLKAERHPDVFHELSEDELSEVLENTDPHSRRHRAAEEELRHRMEMEEKYGDEPTVEDTDLEV